MTMLIAHRPAQAAVRQKHSRLGPYRGDTSAQDKSHRQPETCEQAAGGSGTRFSAACFALHFEQK